MLAKAKINVRCYDNLGYGDRYTIVFTGRDAGGDYLIASADPFHPQGIGQHGGRSFADPPNWRIDRPSYKHLGKKVEFDTLPERVQEFVRQDLF